MTVYVIDDHPLMRDALTMLVQRVRPGLKVVSVHKLSSLESTVERQGEPELFCLDLKLPDTLGLSGVHAVKAKFPNVPLVIVTGSEASECEAACLEAGANLFLEKASPPNTIIEVCALSCPPLKKRRPLPMPPLRPSCQSVRSN